MKKLAMMLLTIIVVPSLALAAEVKNLKVGQEGDKAVATYDLVATSGEKNAEVTVAIIVDGERRISDQLHLSGDLGKNVSVGIGKRIVWDATADLPLDFDGELSWDLRAALIEANSALTAADLYHEGVDEYSAGNLLKAKNIFIDFIDKYPTHSSVAHARYFVGEIYYSDKAYEQAILEFQEVIKNFPDNEKVPVSMLKQAMAFKNLGDGKSSRYVLKKVIERFPQTEQASKAKDLLRN